MGRNRVKRVYLWGGIGNVLYQLNFVLYLKHEGFNVEASTVMLQEEGFLSKLNRHHRGTIAFVENVVERINPKLDVKRRLEFRDILNFAFKKLSLNILGFKYFGHYNPVMAQIEASSFIFGYFQRLPWRSDELSGAMNSLISQLDHDTHQEILVDDNSLVVHLRFGDKENDNAYFLDIGLIENLYPIYKRILFISDNSNRIDEYIKSLHNFDSEFVNWCSNSVLTDFAKLYRAKNIALSRSSFSWWAAELSENSRFIYEPCPFYSHLNWTPFTVKLNKICYEKC